MPDPFLCKYILNYKSFRIEKNRDRAVDIMHPLCAMPVWQESDFPMQPPVDLEFSTEEYQAFKKAFVGVDIDSFWLTPQQLSNPFWKADLLGNLMINWG